MTSLLDPRTGRSQALIPLALAVLLGGCGHRVATKPPPRATDRIAVPAQSSVIDVPVAVGLSQLDAALEQAVPRQLWTIDKPNQTCVASKQVKVLFAKIRTPTVTCRIVGQVTRGSLTLSGHGQAIDIAMPIHAVVSARDIGHVLHEETATADARVHAVVHLTLAPDWSPRGTVRIRYDWTDSPHIDILGRRIDFTDKADAKLHRVIAQLERTLPGQLDKLNLPDRIGSAWRSAFTSLQLNRADPPVWMRITPQQLGYGGYDVAGRTLTLHLGMTARTETFVGAEPPDPPATPLPPVHRIAATGGRVLFAIPVIASYAQLQPVLARALTKRAQRPFDVPGLGPVTVRFQQVVAYGTTGGRIAVGLRFAARTTGGTQSAGTVWLTARPVNAPDSRRIDFTDLAVSGVTDSIGADLLLKIANTSALSGTIAGALSQNFSKDYDHLLAKIGSAIAEKRVGNAVVRARITDIRTGRLQAAGQGVYLPVWGKGQASITLTPG